MFKSRQVRIAGVAVLAMMLLASVAMAQPGQGQARRPRQGGPGGGFFGGGPMGKVMLLMQEDVREHLDLLDEQLEDLQAAQREMMQSMRNREDREGAIRNLEKTIGEVLLPHQSKRLEQLAMQQAMRGGRGLLSDDMVAKLKITDAQKEKIQSRQEQIRDELRQKIAELQKQYEDKILEELTAAQRAQLKTMVGEPFDFSTRQRGFGGFGGIGGRGGAGGAGEPGGRRPGGDRGRGGRRGG
jgi:hypothetical protein